jgi:hypothetical protein
LTVEVRDALEAIRKVFGSHRSRYACRSCAKSVDKNDGVHKKNASAAAFFSCMHRHFDFSPLVNNKIFHSSSPRIYSHYNDPPDQSLCGWGLLIYRKFEDAIVIEWRHCLPIVFSINQNA